MPDFHLIPQLCLPSMRYRFDENFVLFLRVDDKPSTDSREVIFLRLCLPRCCFR